MSLTTDSSHTFIWSYLKRKNTKFPRWKQPSPARSLSAGTVQHAKRANKILNGFLYEHTCTLISARSSKYYYVFLTSGGLKVVECLHARESNRAAGI